MTDASDAVVDHDVATGDVRITGRTGAVCPWDGEVTAYDVTVSYQPGVRVIEAYAFAEYLDAFRDEELSQEQLTDRIAVGLSDALDAGYVQVRIDGTHTEHTDITTTRTVFADG